MSITLSKEDYQKAADAIGCEIEAVRAIAYQESAGNGYMPDGRPKILFEGIMFAYFTRHQYDAEPGAMTIVSNGPGNSYYQLDQWGRFEAAKKLDEEQACASISIGFFQVCGFNARDSAGPASWRPGIGMYPTAKDYIDACMTGAEAQLDSFIRFCKQAVGDQPGAPGYRLNAGDCLRLRNWAAFASIYNGPGYAQNQYDVRIAQWFGFYKAHPEA